METTTWTACPVNLPNGEHVNADWQFIGTAEEAVAEFTRRTGVPATFTKTFRSSTGSHMTFVRVRFDNNATAEICGTN